MSILSSVKKIALDQVNKSSAGPAEPILITPSEYRNQMAEMFLPGGAGISRAFSYTGIQSARKAYTDCPPLTAIINRKAQSHINGRLWILNEKGKEAQNETAKKIRKLLAKPNLLQSWKQFDAQKKIYTQCFGFCLTIAIIPAGFEKYGPIEASALWNIPPNMLDIQETNKLFYKSDISGVIKSIKLSYRGETTELKDQPFCIFRDFTPSFCSMVVPETRIKSLEMPINNIIGAYESRNVLINYRGALGIISSESDKSGYIPIKEGDKQSLQKDFQRYGLKGQQWKFIITSAAVKWQQMGIPTKDLMLFEEVVDSSKAICDSYGFPPHLLGLIDPTFNNQKEAEKGLYQNTIIPESESEDEEWNNWFRTYEYGIRIERDFSHLPVLQEDKVNLATARKILNEALEKEWRNGMITLNQWLVKNGDDPFPETDERGKMYFPEYVKNYGDPMKGIQPGGQQQHDT